ncbi:MAG TPA: AAA family ATPase [Bacillota bacterium]|nr:AAA family ATPase [Bacillota bacterium]HOA14942.1 AAA family ATPase [Bacillota bacterium]HOG53381.1 AAA family ATPase [Bacillota bacterium]
MKKLIVVSGTMGVGKTATCKVLYKMAPRSAWLDGDWCWLMNPWDMSDENKAMAMGNISTVLCSYLYNSTFSNVIFSWVLHKKETIDDLLGRLSGRPYELHAYSLVCTPEELARRMRMDGRDPMQIKASSDRLQLYHDIGWPVVDTTGMSAEETAREIFMLSGMEPE